MISIRKTLFFIILILVCVGVGFAAEFYRSPPDILPEQRVVTECTILADFEQMLDDIETMYALTPSDIRELKYWKSEIAILTGNCQ